MQINHCCQIPSGDALFVFQSRQLLRFAVTRVSRIHCTLRCTVSVKLSDLCCNACCLCLQSTAEFIFYKWDVILNYECLFKLFILFIYIFVFFFKKWNSTHSQKMAKCFGHDLNTCELSSPDNMNERKERITINELFYFVEYCREI